MDIGEKIKQQRVLLGLTQEELADRCELSKGFISQVERNLTSPSISTLTDILQSLGTDLSEKTLKKKRSYLPKTTILKKLTKNSVIRSNG